MSGSSAIQCYCPANGRLLGFVNPSTPDGIDRAIAKAKKAQNEWAKTTFKQRRRVMKTLLKYITIMHTNGIRSHIIDRLPSTDIYLIIKRP